MTWTSFHRRGEILRDVIASANRRRDGVLPLDLPGVAETFGDRLTLVGALQLRWHARLSGRVERELAAQPLDLESAVVTAWHATADELPGLLAVLDRERADSPDPEVRTALDRAAAKEHAMLAMMAGRASAIDTTAARIGAELEERARATYRPRPPEPRPHVGLLGRLKAALAA